MKENRFKTMMLTILTALMLAMSAGVVAGDGSDPLDPSDGGADWDEYIKARVADGEDDPSRLHREMVAIADQLLADADLSGAIDASRY